MGIASRSQTILTLPAHPRMGFTQDTHDSLREYEALATVLALDEGAPPRLNAAQSYDLNSPDRDRAQAEPHMGE